MFRSYSFSIMSCIKTKLNLSLLTISVVRNTLDIYICTGAIPDFINPYSQTPTSKSDIVYNVLLI